MEENSKEKIVENLRHEAGAAKTCFTQFSFQGLVVLAGGLGLLFGNIEKNTSTAFACLPAIIILQVLCRIGIYKYGAANRAYGFQAYIESLNNCSNLEENYASARGECSIEEVKALELIIKNGNFEQIFRAWRIIQPSIFRKIYHTPEYKNMNFWRNLRYYIFSIKTRFLNMVYILLKTLLFLIFRHVFRMDRYKNKSLIGYWGLLILNRKMKFKEYYSLKNSAIKKIKKYTKTRNKNNESENYPWFMLNEITSERYYPGTYLKQMISVLSLFQYIYLSSMLYAFLKVLYSGNINYLELLFYFVSLFLLFCFVFEGGKI